MSLKRLVASAKTDRMTEPRYWDDYEVGQTFPLGSTTFTEQEIVEFGRQFDPQPFHVDPEASKESLFGTLIAVNLQAAFLSPPVAMSAFYLKGVSPSHVTLNEIFAGMMPYMAIIILCMVVMYFWPGLTLWLPNYLYR